MEVYLGIDVGSVTTKLAALDEGGSLLAGLYLRTEGQPVAMVQQGLGQMRERLPAGVGVVGVATTGSARYLAGVVVGADLVKNEISSHAAGALSYVPDVQTVIEVGGQDSKMIILRDGMVVDFGMNTVCAAGTGSFLDHQALRLNMSVADLGTRALESRKPVRIAGCCAVFAESDMVHKQQMGYPMGDILYGLCQALVRNYLDNVGLGKTVLPPVVFQGGVAFNRGIVRALEEALGVPVTVPPHHEVMGAIGAALLVREEMVAQKKGPSRFRGFAVGEAGLQVSSFECDACASMCEVAELSLEGRVQARWGGRCRLYQGAA